MTLFWIPLLLVLGATGSLFSERWGRSACATVTVLFPAVVLATVAFRIPPIFDGRVFRYEAHWIPTLGLNIAFRLDGLSLFFSILILGTLYGTMGSLNMADMSAKVGFIMSENQILAKTGGLLLMLAFSLKSALLPLHFWLPKTYAAASASVVALFAVMTKVGFYSICRVFGGIFRRNAGALANLAIPWIWPLAIATIALGRLGVYAATSLLLLTANMVIVSVGTLLIIFVIEGGQSLLVGFYYMLHSTTVTGALFLIAGQIGTQRGVAMDRFVKARPVTHATLFGGVYL
jgi:multicomponent K+:H+ antiporter subunit D